MSERASYNQCPATRVVVNRTIVERQTIVRTIPPRIIRVPVVRTVWRWRWLWRRRDPLAQTFSFPRNRVVSAVGVEFTAKLNFPLKSYRI